MISYGSVDIISSCDRRMSLIGPLYLLTCSATFKSIKRDTPVLTRGSITSGILGIANGRRSSNVASKI